MMVTTGKILRPRCASLPYSMYCPRRRALPQPLR